MSDKKMKIIGIIAQKKEGKKGRQKDKIFLPCDTSNLYIEFDGEKFEISDFNNK